MRDAPEGDRHMKRTTRITLALSAGLCGLTLVGCSTGQTTSQSNAACFKGPKVSVGPSLVAGDQLAFSTRLAGGYDIRVPDTGSRYATAPSD